MTLAEYASFCAKKVGIDDNLTREEAKAYARLRWKMIWDLRTWRGSLVTHSQAVPAATSEVTLTDTTLGKMVNARWGETESLEGVAADLPFRTDPAAWNTVGKSVAYIERPKDSLGRIVLRLVPAPEVGKDLLCLCKRKCPELTTDLSEPQLEGVDQAMQAYVLGDLCQWLRQYSKADKHYMEAGGHVQTMIDNDTHQSAASQRLTPEGNDYPGELPWR